MLWHIELKFCKWFCFNVLQIKFECRHFASIFEGVMPLCIVNLEYRKYTVFRSFLLHALTYWPEILHMTLFWCTTDQVWVWSFCANFWRSYASLWTYPTGFDIFSWNFAHDFVLMYYRSSLSVVNLRQFLKELCPFWNLEIGNTYFSSVFSYMLWHI